MEIDKDQAANFVGVMIATLRGEIGEATARAERLGAAVTHLRAARDNADEGLVESSRRRAARQERQWRFDDNGAV